jgi:hypothetical protein
MGSEDEVEQSIGRPCRRQVQADMRTEQRNTKKPPLISHKAAANGTDALKVLAA